MTTARFYIGDVFDVLATIPAGSVNLVLTSPPLVDSPRSLEHLPPLAAVQRFHLGRDVGHPFRDLGAAHGSTGTFAPSLDVGLGHEDAPAAAFGMFLDIDTRTQGAA